MLKERDILLASDATVAWELVDEIRAQLELEFTKASVCPEK
jgi:hypothetical protein